MAIAIFLTPNIIHAVFFLIAMLFNLAILLFWLRCDYVALVIPMVYIGAILILFLFVVMMFESDVNVRHEFNIFNLPIIVSIIYIFVNELFLVLPRSIDSIDYIYINCNSNIELIANFIYFYHSYLFFLAGFMLFMAMIGAIIITSSKNLI